MERSRSRDEEWAWVVRQRRDSDFWVSSRGLGSERRETEREITREAVGKELQSSKRWFLHKFFFFTRISAWFKVGFGLIQPFLIYLGQFRLSIDTIQFGVNWRESTNRKNKSDAAQTHSQRRWPPHTTSVRIGCRCGWWPWSHTRAF